MPWSGGWRLKGQGSLGMCHVGAVLKGLLDLEQACLGFKGGMSQEILGACLGIWTLFTSKLSMCVRNINHGAPSTCEPGEGFRGFQHFPQVLQFNKLTSFTYSLPSLSFKQCFYFPLCSRVGGSVHASLSDTPPPLLQVGAVGHGHAIIMLPSFLPFYFNVVSLSFTVQKLSTQHFVLPQ